MSYDVLMLEMLFCELAEVPTPSTSKCSQRVGHYVERMFDEPIDMFDEN
jgi:hypothetical protein